MENDTIIYFSDALYRFAFDQTTVSSIKELGYDKASLVYIVASVLLGGLFILLDYGSVKSKIIEKSFFSLSYSKTNILLMVLVWSVGAGIVSWVGFTTKVFQDTIQSSAVSGLTWIYVLTNILERLRKPEAIQE